jgi:hypothetical protein
MERKSDALLIAASIVGLGACGDPGMGTDPEPAGEQLGESSEALVRNIVVSDATLRGGAYGDTNYGTGKNLVKYATPADFTRLSIFQINLAGVSRASRIAFHAKGRIDKGVAFRIGVYGFDFQGAAWDESTITYNGFIWASVLLPATTWSGPTLTVSGPTDTWYSWDVTKFVNDTIAAGHQSATLVLASETDSDGPVGRFNTRESGFTTGSTNVAPYLTFNSAPSPTSGFPSTMGMAPKTCDSSDMMGMPCTVQPSECTSGTTSFQKAMTCVSGSATCPMSATLGTDYCVVGAGTCGGACGNCDSQSCRIDEDCFPTSVCNQATHTCSGRDSSTNRFICPAPRYGYCWTPGTRPSFGDVCITQ